MTFLFRFLPNHVNLVLYGLALCLINHLILGIILKKIAESNGIKKSWMSMIPVANLWIFGKFVGEFSIGSKRFNRAEIRLLTSSVVFFLIARVPFVGTIVGVAYIALVTFCVLELLKRDIAIEFLPRVKGEYK